MEPLKNNNNKKKQPDVIMAESPLDQGGGKGRGKGTDPSWDSWQR